jgi:hypothetical protein
MNKVRALIALFGGGRELARSIDVSASQVVRWAHKGRMPSDHNHAVMEAASARRIDLGKVVACLEEHVCPCCGQPLEPGQAINRKSSSVRRAVEERGE